MTAVAVSRHRRFWSMFCWMVACLHAPAALHAGESDRCQELDQKVEALLRGGAADVLPAGAHACEKLQFQKRQYQKSQKQTSAESAAAVVPPVSSYPGWIEDLDQCLQTKCYSGPSINTLVTDYCGLNSPAPKACDALFQKPGKPRLRPWRIGLGAGLVTTGVLSIVLGAIHLELPLAPISSGGCTDHGLDLPCAGDRYPTGAALIAVGAAAGVGGILTLTLP